jgi:hypothetical protein
MVCIFIHSISLLLRCGKSNMYPLIHTFSSKHEGKYPIIYAGACMQGRRPYMEDMTVFKTHEDGSAFLGVLDGHGGD